MKTPGGTKVRPTADRVKEALFNILGSHVQGSYFLDLFAGTGNIGIEALSRGAARAVFVEKDVHHIRILEDNLGITGFRSNARLVCLNVSQALPLLGKEQQAYDLIFMDPPYRKGLVAYTLAGIVKNNLIKTGGTIIVESSKKDSLPGDVTGFIKMFRQEKYGDTLLSFYKDL